MIASSLPREEIAEVIRVFHCGYRWWQIAKVSAHRRSAELARSYFLACLEWCTPETAKALYDEVHAVVRELEATLL
jgi:hypothetical protein